MINGDVKEFIEGLYYGDERFFLYNDVEYFIQGYFKNGRPILEIYVLKSVDNNFYWSAISEDGNYPVSDFENAKIFDGRTFWENEKDIEWID